jgi:hypothetical protein
MSFQNLNRPGMLACRPHKAAKGLIGEGTEGTKLANSQNTKVIIVGAGKDGLPIIMDTK